MSILDLVKNTIEGTAEVAINSAKAGIGIVALPVDPEAKTLREAGRGISEGLEKIGKAEKDHG